MFRMLEATSCHLTLPAQSHFYGCYTSYSALSRGGTAIGIIGQLSRTPVGDKAQ
jgi:hypothetical protein